MKAKGPNWGLAFGSGSFLVVWLLGLSANVTIEVVAVRATIATIIGAAVGMLLGQTIEGLHKYANTPPAKGHQIDITLPADEAELRVPPPGELERVVPAEPAGESFKPLDFKKAARQVQTGMKERDGLK